MKADIMSLNLSPPGSGFFWYGIFQRIPNARILSDEELQTVFFIIINYNKRSIPKWVKSCLRRGMICLN